jgi:MFS family permease
MHDTDGEEQRGFGRYWTAHTLSAFGTTATAVALPVLVVTELEADPFQVGLVNAAQFLPYALLGLVAGVYVDRWRRRRTLVVASLGRALSLGLIPLLWAMGALSVGVLVVLLLLFGAFSVFGFAASQSLLPRLVPPTRLLRANARLDQGEAAAQTLGPTLAGLLVRWAGAPVALLLDAVTYAVDALLVSRLRLHEEPARIRGNVWRDMKAGVRATYRHPVLLSLSLSTHVWFIANAASLTLLSLLALRGLELGAALFGLLLSAVGAATLLGASFAERLGLRFGEGATIVSARLVYPFVWAAVGVVPILDAAAGTVVLFVALTLGGLAAGVENANEMSYRQRAVPDGLLGRVNATARSVNRTAGAAGALAGGLCATAVGVVTSIWIVAGVFAVAAVVAVASPLRSARA